MPLNYNCRRIHWTLWGSCVDNVN